MISYKMKFSIVLLGILAFSANSNEIKNEVNNEKAQSLINDCDNPCGSCQKTIYHLKFNQMADCGNGYCRNTCYKVKEQWSVEDGVFKPFKSDIFGKCEICFRAGYCSIEECKIQQEKEAEIIDRIVNASHMTGKKVDILQEIGMNQFSFEKNVTPMEDIDSLSDKFVGIKNEINLKLDATINNAIKIDDVAGEVQTMINGGFTNEKTFTITEIKAFVNQKPNKEQTTHKLKESTKLLIESINKLAKDEKAESNVLKENFEHLKAMIKENNDLIEKAKEKKQNDAIDLFTQINKDLEGGKAKLEKRMNSKEKSAKSDKDDSDDSKEVVEHEVIVEKKTDKGDIKVETKVIKEKKVKKQGKKEKKEKKSKKRRYY